MNPTYGVLAAALCVAACGPTINDRERLPARVATCGADWKLDVEQAPVTHSAAALLIAAEPVVFDLPSGLCPTGACTVADFRVPVAQRRPCQELLWVRVGWDAYVRYGMLHTVLTGSPLAVSGRPVGHLALPHVTFGHAELDRERGWMPSMELVVTTGSRGYRTILLLGFVIVVLIVAVWVAVGAWIEALPRHHPHPK